ncbi:MAG: hypothetical protein Q9170_002835 [Blastenia crenularia]
MQLTLKSSLALAAATLLTSVNAHSWIEEVRVIAGNGSFVGESGYPRAFAKRAAGVDPDKAMVHLLPPNGRSTGNQILDSDLMCMPSQQQPKQSDGSPMLKAAAGDNIALRYQENGHVTLPQNQPGKPENRGTVYIYGTTNPSPDDKFLSIHKVWNPDGTGGDKRGKLLATESFDDGQCYQMNGGQISAQRQAQFKHKADQTMGQDLWCQNDFKIPKDAPSGKPYTVYWVWDWDTAPGTAGQPKGLLEKYTTCMDIDVEGQANTQSNPSASGSVKLAEGQDLDFAAIPHYVEQLNAGKSIFYPGSVPDNKGAANAPSAAAPQSSQPAAAAASAPAMSQSSPPAATGQMTVTVTAPASGMTTVTVTASNQSPMASAASTPITTMITTHSTVYVTQSSMQTMPASSNMASQVSMSGATVSGVPIPTVSMSRFTGTASPMPAQTVASAPATVPSTSGSAGNVKQCAASSCKPGKRSMIFSKGDGKGSSSHVAANTKFRNPSSLRLRGI